MFEGYRDLGDQVAEAVMGILTPEEREFASLPDGELLGRYALEAFIQIVSVSATGLDENRG